MGVAIVKISGSPHEYDKVSLSIDDSVTIEELGCFLQTLLRNPKFQMSKSSELKDAFSKINWTYKRRCSDIQNGRFKWNSLRISPGIYLDIIYDKTVATSMAL